MTHHSSFCYATVCDCSYHGLPGWTAELTELRYRTCLGDAEASYTTRSHPLPITSQESIEQQTVLSVLASLFLIIPLVRYRTI